MPPSDKTDMEQRIAATSPASKMRGFFFQHIVELVKQRVSADAAQRLLAPLRPEGYSALKAYPVAEFLRLLYAAVDELEPQLGVEAAFRTCGATALDVFATSGVGRALFGVLCRGDPARLGAQASLAYATVASYGKREFHQTGPSSGTIQYRDIYLPPLYNEGVVLRALELLGYRGNVTRIERGVTAVDFEVSWEPIEK